MQFLKSWNGSKKRPADESIQEQESLRKRSKDDKRWQDSIGIGIGTGTGTGSAIGTAIERDQDQDQDQEYRIRATSIINKDVSPTKPPRSPPLIHPDRRDNILSTDSAPTPAPTALINRDSPPSSSSHNPEHIDKGAP